MGGAKSIGRLGETFYAFLIRRKIYLGRWERSVRRFTCLEAFLFLFSGSSTLLEHGPSSGCDHRRRTLGQAPLTSRRRTTTNAIGSRFRNLREARESFCRKSKKATYSWATPGCDRSLCHPAQKVRRTLSSHATRECAKRFTWWASNRRDLPRPLRLRDVWPNWWLKLFSFSWTAVPGNHYDAYRTLFESRL
jgi:hypothetical protein